MIRCLSSIQWGAERDILLTMYKTLVLSRIDYGSIVYSSARHSHLKKLDYIQNTGLRLATGAFRTSPIRALEVEAGIPPLTLRRERLMVNYATSIKAQPQHPNYSILFESDNNIFTTRPTITKPLTARLERDTLISEIYPKKFPSDPPWQFTVSPHNLECANYSKHETNHVLIKNNFYRILHNYTNTEEIYTDGSKTENGVGCAFVAGDEIHSWSLPEMASVYTAEMYAIWQALRFCEFSSRHSFLICTDSMSSLQSISNTFNTDPLAVNILTLLHWLKHINKNITFIFTPSHIGIPGNEKADQAARSAAEHNDGAAGIPIRDNDIIVENKNRYKRKWQYLWNRTETVYRRIHPEVNTWKSPLKQTRREQVVLTRLRLTHTHLTSIHLLKGDPAPICPRCRVSLTVEHILVECPAYTHLRQLLDLGNNLRSILGNNKSSIDKVLNFIKAIGLIRRI